MPSFRPVMGVAVIVLAIVAGACDPGTPGQRLVERSRVSMSASLRVSSSTTDEAKAVAAAERVGQEFDRLEALLSVWKEGSDVLRLNKAAGLQPVQVSRETLDVLTAARLASEQTAGKFDITFGALADIWKFDHDQDNVIPDRASIEKRLPLVNYRAVHLDAAKGTAFISRPGMRIHLGGIGKGYAIDRAVDLLRNDGFQDFLIQSGGDIYASGTSNGTPWKLGIADPRGSHEAFAAVVIRDATFSTSGDYERSFIKDGVRYHHLIDPDRAVDLLRNDGFQDFLIQSGGDIYASGTSNGTPWKLGIADPRGSHEAFAAVVIRDATFSTSGDYERSFIKDGVRYHHLIDPD